MSLSRLLKANPDLNPDRIRVGDTVNIDGPPPQIEYTIERGDTVSTIAQRFKVHEREIKKWNASLNANRLRLGEKIAMFSEVSPPSSESWGATNQGKLRYPVQLPINPMYDSQCGTIGNQ
ncbi:MAG: LysM peptidoglycan-binding domain-containing protein [Polyangiales bacterium]